MRTLVMLVTIWPIVATAGPYEDCILQNMKGVQAQAAAGAIMRACKEKTTPVKCRTLTTNPRPTLTDQASGTKPWERDWSKPNFFDQFDLDACIKECAAASWWDRTFGECKTD